MSGKKLIDVLVVRLTREEELETNTRDALEARNITVYDEQRWSEAVGQLRGVHWVLCGRNVPRDFQQVRKGIERCAQEQ